ncbi:MAG: caspase family protein [Tenuifilaceae bacterium]
MKRLFLIFLSFIALSANAQNAILTQNIGHSSRVKDISISQDGRYLLSADDDGVMKLWDNELSREIRTFKDDEVRITKASFSPDGKSVFASAGRKVTQWNTLTGEVIQSFIGSSDIVISFSVKSKENLLVVSNIKGEVLLFNITDGKLVSKTKSKLKNSSDNLVEFHPSSDIAISYYKPFYYESEENDIRVWNYKTNETLFKLDEGGFSFYRLMFSTDGKYIVAVGRKSISYSKVVDKVRLYKTENGAFVSDFTIREGYDSAERNIVLSASTDKSVIAFAFYEELFLLNINTGLIKQISKHQAGIDCIKISSHENSVFISNYYNVFSVDFVAEKVSRSFLSLTNYVKSSAISSDGKYLAVSFHGGFKVFDLEKGKLLPLRISKFSDVTYLAFDSGGQFLATLQTPWMDTARACIYNVKTSSVVKTLLIKEGVPSSISINSSLTKLAISLNQSDGNKKVIIYSLPDGNKIFEDPNFKKELGMVSFTKDDKYLIASGTGVTKVYDLSSNMQIAEHKPHSLDNSIHSLSSTGSIMLSAGGDVYGGALVLWDYKNGKTLNGKFKGVDVGISSCAISPDNSIVAATVGHWIFRFVGKKDLEVKIWDAKTGALKTKLFDEKNVTDLQYSPNGKFLYTICKFGSIGIWETDSFKKIGEITSVGLNDWTVHTIDGRFDGNTEGIKNLHYVNGLNVIPLESLYEQYYHPNLLAQIFSNTEMEKPSVDISQISLPPAIKILSPINQITVTSCDVSVTVQAVDQGGGVNEIRLYHNGKLFDGTQRGFKSTGQNSTFNISLVDGENRIKVVALNNQRTESVPSEITLYYKAPQQVKPNMYILAVGINSYLNPKYNLNYAKNDADAFVKSLSTGANSLFGKVEVSSVSDANATREGIISAIDKITLTAKPEDVFVLYYAGHGVMSSGSETEKSQFYIVPHNVTKMYEADDMLKKSGISATEIGEFSKNIKAQKQLFVIDACQSGGAMQTLAMRGAAEEKAIAQLARSTGTYFIAASGSEQFATEVAELGHGVFTYSVIEALKGSCKSKDGKVTVNLLKSCVEDLVPELSKKYKGQPQFPTGYGFGQDFPIGIVK